MQTRLVIAALALALHAGLEHASATTVSGFVPFNTIVTGDQTLPFATTAIIANDGQGNTANILLTITSVNGELFNKLDGNTRLSIGTTFDDENHVNVGETTTFTAQLVSRSGPLNLVGFNIATLGLRDTGDPSVSWTSSVTPVAVVTSNFINEANHAMDNPANFHRLNSSSYLGTLTVNANQFQFTDVNGASGIGFTVQFTATPEPATATLGLLALAGLMARRRAA